MLADLWTRVTSTQPPLPWWAALLLGAVAFAVTWSPTGHRLVRHLVTVVHEAGHALVAVLVGRRLRGVRLHSDTSGVTVSRGRTTGAGMVATVAAGYPAPALAGLAGALLLGAGYAVGLLWAVVLMCALMLVVVRNLYGLWVVLVTGVSLAGLCWVAPTALLVGLAHVVVWCLLLAAPRSVLQMQAQRRHAADRRSDADQLARLTRTPAVLWVAVFWLVCAVCLLLGGTRLVMIG